MGGCVGFGFVDPALGVWGLHEGRGLGAFEKGHGIAGVGAGDLFEEGCGLLDELLAEVADA